MTKQLTQTSEILIASHQEQGRRPNLEDRVSTQNVKTAGGLALTVAIVADGVGGSEFGELAAELTVKTALREIEDATETEPARIPMILERALEQANETVYKEGRADRTKRGMSTTATIAAIHNNKLYVANVGDSRAYLVRGSKGEELTQLTQDHTWAWEMVAANKLLPIEADKHPKAGELVRSIGYDPTIKVDLSLLYRNGTGGNGQQNWQGLQLQANDRVVLCSDGLIKERHDGVGHYVEDIEIAQIVTRMAPEKAAPALVKKAIDRSADDNVSAIVVEMPGSQRAFYLPTTMKYGGTAVLGLILLLTLFALLRSREPDNPLTPTVPATPVIVAVGNAALPPVPAERATVTPSSENENSKVYQEAGEHSLPNGGRVFLNETAQIKVNGNNLLMTGKGVLVVDATGQLIVVQNPYGAVAEVNDGVLGVTYDEDPFIFEVACLRGSCRLQGDLRDDEVTLGEGQTSIVGGSGVPSEATVTEYGKYHDLAINIVPAPTMTPTPTATSTPTLVPTPTKMPPPPSTFTPTPEVPTETPEPVPPTPGDSDDEHGSGPPGQR